jgi:hypothetical protein
MEMKIMQYRIRITEFTAKGDKLIIKETSSPTRAFELCDDAMHRVVLQRKNAPRYAGMFTLELRPVRSAPWLPVAIG